MQQGLFRGRGEECGAGMASGDDEIDHERPQELQILSIIEK